VKRTFWLILFGVLVFAGIVVARLPARWILPDPKSGMTCADADGTVWNGTCSGFTVQQQPLGDLSWELHALRLLAGKLNGDFVLTRATGSAHGNVECGFDKKIIARNVEADLPVDRDLSAALPPAFQALRGKLHAQIAYLRLDGQVIKAIEGVIVARDLTDGEGATSQPWGSYSLTFPPPTNGEPLGRLADLGTGPLAVEGSLRLTPEPGFDLEGLVAARPSAPAGLAQEIQFLGSPDAQGRRPFSLAGTF
jgi:general secretion pathway protein N